MFPPNLSCNIALCVLPCVLVPSSRLSEQHRSRQFCFYISIPRFTIQNMYNTLNLLSACQSRCGRALQRVVSVIWLTTHTRRAQPTLCCSCVTVWDWLVCAEVYAGLTDLHFSKLPRESHGVQERPQVEAWFIMSVWIVCFTYATDLRLSSGLYDSCINRGIRTRQPKERRNIGILQHDKKVSRLSSCVDYEHIRKRTAWPFRQSETS